MSTRFTVLGAGVGLSFVAASLSLAACASDEEAAVLEPDGTETVTLQSDAGALDVVDGGDGGALCTTDDCVFFPDACGPEVLCLNGLFDSVDSSAEPSWRTRVTAIGGRSPADVWLVGTVGMAAHFDGTSWNQADLGTGESLRFLWLTSAGEVAFGTPDRLYSRGLGSEDAGISPDGWAVRSIAEYSASSVVTATWTMPGSNLLWLATNTDVRRLELNGSTFTSRPGLPASVCQSRPCRWLRSLHGTSAGTIWAVGDNGAAVRILGADGDAPELQVTNPLTWKRLNGVWAVSDTEAWAVGVDGTILHNTGAQSSWEVVTNVPTTEHLNAVTGSSSSDIWAVGDAGVVLHYDGTAWSRVKIAGLGTRRPDLYTVWSAGPGQVWIGGQGVLLALGDKR